MGDLPFGRSLTPRQNVGLFMTTIPSVGAGHEIEAAGEGSRKKRLGRRGSVSRSGVTRFDLGGGAECLSGRRSFASSPPCSESIALGDLLFPCLITSLPDSFTERFPAAEFESPVIPFSVAGNFYTATFISSNLQTCFAFTFAFCGRS